MPITSQLGDRLRCIACGSRETRVIDKRDSEDAAVTRRRRECLACQRRFTTYERSEALALRIAKRDGRRQEFDRAKLRASLEKACTKRPISAETIERVLDEIELELRAIDSLEVESTAVGDLVMGKLRSLDEVAYIRFASVYRDFRDASSFDQELRNLIGT